MQPRTTGILLLVALALGAFVWWYEIGGEDARRDAEERAERLFRGIEPEDVAWIELRTSDGADARLERRDGAWHLAAPIDFPADAAAERMADTLATLAPEATFEEPRPDAEYGLDDDSASVVRFGAGEAAHALRLGDETPVGANVYARAGEGTSVVTLASFRANVFERSLEQLRDKQVLALDGTAVRELEASWPGGRVLAERDAAPAAEGEGEEEEDAPDPEDPLAEPPAGPDWRLRAPLEAPADAEALERLLSTLSFLRAEAFDDAPGPERLALLDPPDFAVTLRGAGDAPIALAVSRPEGERRWVRVAGREPLFGIPAARIEDFPRRSVEYRQRELASFPMMDAQRIDFLFQAEDGDPVVIHAKRGDAGWSSEPESFAPGKLSRAVSELSRLEADDVVAESMGELELAGVGLSPPEATIVVFGERPEDADEDAPLPVLAELHLGKLTPEGVVARSAGSPTIYRLGMERAEQLPVSLSAFRDRFRAAGEAELEEPLGASQPGDSGDLPDPGEESP